MNTALEVHDLFCGDGLRFSLPNGETMHDVCSDHGGKRDEDIARGAVSWTFNDGSGIVACGKSWDLRHDDCECGFCLAGADLLCLVPAKQAFNLTIVARNPGLQRTRVRDDEGTFWVLDEALAEPISGFLRGDALAEAYAQWCTDADANEEA